MRVVKKYIAIILCIFLFIINIGRDTLAETDKYASVFNVLIINSYHIEHYWESYVMEGFKEAVKDYDENKINIKVEYFDFRNRNDAEYVASFIEFIEKKYQKGNIDAIYTVDDEAFSVILPIITDENSELYHIPLLFSGVDSNITFTEEEDEYVTGIYQGDVTLEEFNLMLQIDDTIDCINIITESSSFGNNLINKSNNIITEHLENEVNLNIIQSDYIEDIEEQLKEMKSDGSDSKKNEVILLGGEFQYKDTGVFVDPKDSVEVIRKYLKWPIYVNDPTYLSANILGGCMDIGQLQGEDIFGRVERLIEGEHISDIEKDFAPSPKWLLKYNAIYDYNINIDNIPRKCEVIDKKFYQFVIPKYVKVMIWSLVILILILIIFLLYKLIVAIKKFKRQQKENEIRIAREKMQTDFIINISHELRTPINIILSGSSLIKVYLNKIQNQMDKLYLQEKLNIITQNAYRLLKLANNIIDVKKIESGGIVLNRKNVNIVEIVESIFSEIVEYANKKNIKMIFDTNKEEITVSADRELIQRVILNILSNSIKFTAYGGKIYTRIKAEKDEVNIEIEDTGIGIPEEELDNIFYKFYQVDNSLSRVNEGSGIGLSIVKELVQLHNGKILIQSQIDKGTIIKVILPITGEPKDEENEFRANLNTAVNIEMADVIK